VTEARAEHAIQHATAVCVGGGSGRHRRGGVGGGVRFGLCLGFGRCLGRCFGQCFCFGLCL
jgi:hypothetical protein